MRNLFFTSKNIDYVDHVRLLLEDIWPDETWNFSSEFSNDLNLEIFKTILRGHPLYFFALKPNHYYCILPKNSS